MSEACDRRRTNGKAREDVASGLRGFDNRQPRTREGKDGGRSWIKKRTVRGKHILIEVYRRGRDLTWFAQENFHLVAL